MPGEIATDECTDRPPQRGKVTVKPTFFKRSPEPAQVSVWAPASRRAQTRSIPIDDVCPGPASLNGAHDIAKVKVVVIDPGKMHPPDDLTRCPKHDDLCRIAEKLGEWASPLEVAGHEPRTHRAQTGTLHDKSQGLGGRNPGPLGNSSNPQLGEESRRTPVTLGIPPSHEPAPAISLEHPRLPPHTEEGMASPATLEPPGDKRPATDAPRLLDTGKKQRITTARPQDKRSSARGTTEDLEAFGNTSPLARNERMARRSNQVGVQGFVRH